MRQSDAVTVAWWGSVGAVALCGLGPLLAVIVVFSLPWARITTLEGLEQRAWVGFPSGTTLIKAEYQRGLDGAGFAKLIIPRDRVSDLLSDAKSRQWQLSRSQRNLTNSMYSRGLGWWEPESISRFVAISAGIGSPPGNYSLRLLVDLGDPGAAVTYMYFTLG